MCDIKFRKLKADEIDIRVGRVVKTETFSGATLLLYKDARVDMQLLDETVGPSKWKRDHEVINGNLYCTISIWNDAINQWVGKQDCGTESNTEKEKGEASDSFKRAGTNWGIGRELYTAKNIIVSCDLDKDGKKPANGISWYVKEIDYNENNISKLVIMQRQKGKADAIAYSFEAGKFPVKPTNKTTTKNEVVKTETPPQAENPPPMTVEEAERVTFKDKLGKEIAVGSLNIDSLERLTRATAPELAKAREAAEIVFNDFISQTAQPQGKQ